MTETTTTEPFQREVLLRVPRRYDLDIHVAKITIEDGTYVDVREFIPSLQQYGRGILIPADRAESLGESISRLGETLAGASDG